MDIMTDLNAYLNVGASGTSSDVRHSTNKKAGTGLELDDYLQLMIATFQNQSIDNTASTSDMMNQMVQMTVIQAVSDLNKIVSETSGMNYASALVGKEVTIGQNNLGEVEQIVGKVTGTGTLDGEQVIFIGDKMFKLSDVIAVGRIPSDVKTTELSASGSSSTSGVARNAPSQSSGSAASESDYEYVTDSSGTMRVIYKGDDSGEVPSSAAAAAQVAGSAGGSVIPAQGADANSGVVVQSAGASVLSGYDGSEPQSDISYINDNGTVRVVMNDGSNAPGAMFVNGNSALRNNANITSVAGQSPSGTVQSGSVQSIGGGVSVAGTSEAQSALSAANAAQAAAEDGAIPKVSVAQLNAAQANAQAAASTQILSEGQVSVASVNASAAQAGAQSVQSSWQPRERLTGSALVDQVMGIVAGYDPDK